MSSEPEKAIPQGKRIGRGLGFVLSGFVFLGRDNVTIQVIGRLIPIFNKEEETIHKWAMNLVIQKGKLQYHRNVDKTSQSNPNQPSVVLVFIVRNTCPPRLCFLCNPNIVPTPNAECVL